MTTYTIAQDNNGCTGSATNNLQACVNLGLKKGYEGFAQEKLAVLDFLTASYLRACEEGKNYIPFVVTDTVITYAYLSDPKWGGDGKWHAAHEPALALVSDKSPLYAADMSDDEWKILVEQYAADLGAAFDQFRVYVTYTRTEEMKILQKA
jgi:hypothetical protein